MRRRLLYDRRLSIRHHPKSGGRLHKAESLCVSLCFVPNCIYIHSDSKAWGGLAEGLIYAARIMEILYLIRICYNHVIESYLADMQFS